MTPAFVLPAILFAKASSMLFALTTYAITTRFAPEATGAMAA